MKRLLKWSASPRPSVWWFWASPSWSCRSSAMCLSEKTASSPPNTTREARGSCSTQAFGEYIDGRHCRLWVCSRQIDIEARRDAHRRPASGELSTVLMVKQELVSGPTWGDSSYEWGLLPRDVAKMKTTPWYPPLKRAFVLPPNRNYCEISLILFGILQVSTWQTCQGLLVVSISPKTAPNNKSWWHMICSGKYRFMSNVY